MFAFEELLPAFQGEWQKGSFHYQNNRLIHWLKQCCCSVSGSSQHTESRRLPVISSWVHIRHKTRNMVRNAPLPPRWLILPLCGSNWEKSAPAAWLRAEIMHQGKHTVYISAHLSVAPHAAWGRSRCQSSGDPLRHRPPATLVPALRCPTAAWLEAEQLLCSSNQRQLRERLRCFPSDIQTGRRGVCRVGAQVEAGDDEERERKGRRKGVVERRRIS